MMEIKNKITIQEAVDLLNNAIECDADAIRTMCLTRFKCNEKLKEHPTIQVHGNSDGSGGVGLVGVLNGMFGIAKDGSGAIAAFYEVECPNNCEPDYPSEFEGLTIKDKCPRCQAQLGLGKIIKFGIVRNPGD